MHFDLGIVYLDEYKAYRRDQENVDIFSDIFKIVKPPFDRAYYPNRKIFAMQIFDTEMVPILEKEMPELIFNRANQYGYDINLKGDLKADGVRILMDYFKIKSEDIYAFGDGINDVSMIKLAGHGIAMGNACEELKSVADYITDNVDDNGIINALKHFKLI
jgi:hydroxymethylpyrimidine pyrophosphatase-like HAD family hydrolase